MSRLRGPVLLALLRSSDAEVRGAGLSVLRDALAAAGSTVAAARALGVAPRTIQRAIAARPELREGIELRGRGRPRRRDTVAG